MADLSAAQERDVVDAVVDAVEIGLGREILFQTGRERSEAEEEEEGRERYFARGPLVGARITTEALRFASGPATDVTVTLADGTVVLIRVKVQ